MNIADAPDTVVEDLGQRRVRSCTGADGIGLIGDETDSGAPGLLADFVGQPHRSTGLTAPTDRLGSCKLRFQSEDIFPDACLRGSATTPQPTIEPTVVDWPADALGATRRCQRMRRHPRGRGSAGLFADANQLTFFADDGITYQLTVKSQLPGDGC